ncbi:IS6 family transposase [Paraburkholderia sediminicola]|uniref:IS6 family transposase n=1 Tax=Paraburkholderia sediminicola TaxID=458836 RepID=UPI0038B73C41
MEEIAGARPSPRPCGSDSNANPRSVSSRRASPCLTQSHTAFRFQLSLRDIEELLFERGVTVSYETIRRWCEKKFGASFAHRVKAARRKPGSTWHLDEMFVTVRGERDLPWRAVDEHGVELDILPQERRDKAAAKRFFKRVLRSNPVLREIVTDQLRSYPAAKTDIPELAKVKDVLVRAATLLTNRAVNSHQPTRERERERRMRGFHDLKSTQAFQSSLGPIRQHFALKRHLLRASLYRKHLAAPFAIWRELINVTQTPPNVL